MGVEEVVGEQSVGVPELVDFDDDSGDLAHADPTATIPLIGMTQTWTKRTGSGNRRRLSEAPPANSCRTKSKFNPCSDNSEQ